MNTYIMYKGGLVVKKQEMTKMWIQDMFVPVTLVKVVSQEIVRYKTTEKDWYTAALIGVEKKEVPAKKGSKIVYSSVMEFDVDENFIQNNQVGKILDVDTVQWSELSDITWYSKGKWFQGMVKRFHIKGGWATHGHKFTRTGWSKGNRKPRRTLKGHPHAGHMGMDRITLKNVKILDVMKRDNEQILVLKWSLPGAYNGLLKLSIK